MLIGDFFAGIGGFHLAFNDLGVGCEYACEIDDYVRKTYNHNFNVAQFDYDITKVKDLPDFDIFCGGFPCQPFSMAGLRKGIEDERGKVFLDILRILKDKKPRAFLLENVKGLLSHEKGATYAWMKEQLSDLGYNVFGKVLNTAEHGNIPQNRERIFIVGLLNSNTFEFPEAIPLTTKIRDFITEEDVDEKLYYENNAVYPELKKHITSKDTMYQWRRTYVRENKSKECPTLTANMGTGGHNVPLILTYDNRIRKLTPRECLNFQGYPDDYEFTPKLSNTRAYYQAGNSITVPVVKRIAEKILKYM